MTRNKISTQEKEDHRKNRNTWNQHPRHRHNEQKHEAMSSNYKQHKSRTETPNETGNRQWHAQRHHGDQRKYRSRRTRPDRTRTKKKKQKKKRISGTTRNRKNKWYRQRSQSRRAEELMPTNRSTTAPQEQVMEVKSREHSLALRGNSTTTNRPAGPNNGKLTHSSKPDDRKCPAEQARRPKKNVANPKTQEHVRQEQRMKRYFAPRGPAGRTAVIAPTITKVVNAPEKKKKTSTDAQVRKQHANLSCGGCHTELAARKELRRNPAKSKTQNQKYPGTVKPRKNNRGKDCKNILYSTKKKKTLYYINIIIFYTQINSPNQIIFK